MNQGAIVGFFPLVGGPVSVAGGKTARLACASPWRCAIVVMVDRHRQHGGHGYGRDDRPHGVRQGFNLPCLEWSVVSYRNIAYFGGYPRMIL